MEIALDPIGYSEALQKAGMPREQADIIARTQDAREKRIIESRELATKKDIAILKQDLADLRAELKQDIASAVAASERHLTNLLLGVAAVIIAAIGVAVAILK